MIRKLHRSTNENATHCIVSLPKRIYIAIENSADDYK